MPKAFSKLAMASFIAVLSLELSAETEATNSGNTPVQSNAWEQAESRRLFGEARRLQLESNLIESLKLYSEILEFFPNTDVWPLTCIELSDIYLRRKNIQASEKVLKRLLSYRSSQGLVQDEHSLLAQWDFFEKLGRIQDLIAWLDKRNRDEKAKLRESTPLSNRLQQLARNEAKANLTELEQLFSALGYQRSLSALISLMDHPDFLFPEDRLKELLFKCVANEDLNLLRRVVMTMQKAGWTKSVHSAFLECDQHPNAQSWQRLWIQVLIESRMWKEAEGLLQKLPAQDWGREILLISIGQSQWDQAFLKIQEMEKWIFSSLTLEDLITFAQGIQKNPNSNYLYVDFLKMMPEGSKKKLLLATLSKDRDEKLNLLNELKSDPYYLKRALLELGKLHQKERNLKEIETLYRELEKHDPESPELKELKLIHDTLKGLEKPAPQKT